MEEIRAAVNAALNARKADASNGRYLMPKTQKKQVGKKSHSRGFYVNLTVYYANFLQYSRFSAISRRCVIKFYANQIIRKYKQIGENDRN
jgi:hypothetical protein